MQGATPYLAVEMRPHFTFENRSQSTTGELMMFEAQPRGVANRAAFIVKMLIKVNVSLD